MPYARFTVHQYNGYDEDRTFSTGKIDIVRSLRAEWQRAGCPALPARLRALGVTVHILSEEENTTHAEDL